MINEAHIGARGFNVKGRRILLSGGNGDLGTVLAPRMVSAGGAVVSLDPAPSDQSGVESVQGSILERPLVNELVASSDLVIHIAAWHGYHAFTRAKTTEDFWDLNMTGTFNLLDACARHNKRKFIFISSTSTDEWPEVYGMTKVLGEDLCRAYAHRHAMQILALRPRAFIPWWNTKVYSSKSEWATWFARGAVHIHDVAQSVELACRVIGNLDVPYFEVIEIDGKHDFTPLDLESWRNRGAKQFLAERFPAFSEAINEATFIPETPPTYRDLTKARAVLGYEPSYGYAEMLSDLSR
jgi:nucleoside-diphosphate-sugar epimerase